MIQAVSKARTTAMAGKYLLFPFVLACLVLPIEFLAQVDGLLKYRTPFEILQIFSIGWVGYFLLGLMVILPLIVARRLFTRWRGKNIEPHWATLDQYITLLWLAVAFLNGFLAWGSAMGFWQYAGSLGVVAVLVALAAILALPCWFSPNVRLAVQEKLGGLMPLFFGMGLISVLLASYTMASSGEGPDLPQQPVLDAASRPNVVLLSIDALTARHMSVYGYPRKTTPNLDRFAETSLVFDRFYANSNFTTPTVNSMINGVRPWTHRVINVAGNSSLDLELAGKGLPAVLKSSGYRTYAVATNIWAAPNQNGSAKYFDRVRYGMVNVTRNWLSAWLADVPMAVPLIGQFTPVECSKAANVLLRAIKGRNWHYDPRLASDAGKKMLQQSHGEGPFFLWIHYLPPHGPYAAPEPFLGAFDKSMGHRSPRNSHAPYGFAAGADPDFPGGYVARYDESILYIDHYIGELLKWMERQPWYDNSIVAVTADHGESFSHGYGGHTGVALFDELVHIPLMVKLPKQVKGQVSAELAEQVDLAPSIMHAAGIPLPSGLEGRPLFDRNGLLPRDERPVYSMNFERTSRFGELSVGTVAMIQGKWKYTTYFGYKDSDLYGLQDSLVDIEADPGEQTDLKGEHPDIAGRMKQAIAGKMREHGSVVHE